MMFTRSIPAVALIAGLCGAATGQTLTTAPANNGSGGVFMDLTPTGAALQVTSFDVPYTGTVNTTVDVEVWTRPGTYVGFDASSAGWTLTQTVTGTRMGATTPSPLVLTTPIDVPAGGTTAIYLQAIATGGIRYTGLAATPPQTTWSNADVTLFSDVARVATTAFTGTRFQPRTFSGTVHYTLGSAACYANCDGSTLPPVLNVLDFNCFLNQFSAGASYANCDGSTVAPVLNVLDFNCFLNRFTAGCP